MSDPLTQTAQEVAECLDEGVRSTAEIHARAAATALAEAPYTAFHLDSYKKSTVIVENASYSNREARADAMEAVRVELGGAGPQSGSRLTPGGSVGRKVAIDGQPGQDRSDGMAGFIPFEHRVHFADGMQAQIRLTVGGLPTGVPALVYDLVARAALLDSVAQTVAPADRSR